MVNAFILEKLAGKMKQTDLDFCRELAKLLIAGYNGYKRPSNTGKSVLQTVTTEENLGGHFLGKLSRQDKGLRSVCQVTKEAT